VVTDPNVDVVVELIGGYTLAKDVVLKAIEYGKHVVTANKALIALHGNEIFAAAKAKGVIVAFEAGVAGGIPIIKALREGEVSRIILTRPAVSVDEKHGFLPGDLNAKMEPWTRPIFDVFEEYYGLQETKRMLEEGIIEVAPLGFMRGRTFKHAYVILDEAQNCTPNQMTMVLTRLGEGSSIIVTGDLNQHDRGYEENGLKDFLKRFPKSDSDIAICKFERCHVERDPLVSKVLGIYGQD